MAFPNITADADPDPTTQIAWPNARPKRVRQAHLEDSPHYQSERGDDDGTVDTHGLVDSSKNSKMTIEPGGRYLSTWDLITLSVSMAGAQVAWTVELGYTEIRVSLDCC
jgi:solute carrier family 45 protein 1/2/4